MSDPLGATADEMMDDLSNQMLGVIEARDAAYARVKELERALLEEATAWHTTGDQHYGRAAEAFVRAARCAALAGKIGHDETP